MQDSDCAQSNRISPTAHATGYFWYAHGLSHPALATSQGRRLHYALRPLVMGVKLLGGLSLDATLLARHRGIDEKLEAAIQSGKIGQIIEIAAGLSPRAWRFAQRHGQGIQYLETDLPAMAATKQTCLRNASLLSGHHRVVELDALAAGGPQSLQAVAATLNPNIGTAIITEGLINYLSPDQVSRLWRNIVATLTAFPRGLYLTDLHFRSVRRSPVVKLFGNSLSRVVGSRMHVHFDNADHAMRIMLQHGFDEAQVERATRLAANHDIANNQSARHVHVLAARTHQTKD